MATGPGRAEWGLCCFGDDYYDGYFNDTMWTDPAARDAWVEMWRFTAERYRDNPIVAGYKLMVEPNAADLLLVAPATWFGGPPLAAMLAENPLTAEFASFALRLVPLACLATIPFFICRPIFEGMGQGHPGQPQSKQQVSQYHINPWPELGDGSPYKRAG